jgi:hypothetical protein
MIHLKSSKKVIITLDSEKGRLQIEKHVSGHPQAADGYFLTHMLGKDLDRKSCNETYA